MPLCRSLPDTTENSARRKRPAATLRTFLLPSLLPLFLIANEGGPLQAALNRPATEAGHATTLTPIRRGDAHSADSAERSRTTAAKTLVLFGAALAAAVILRRLLQQRGPLGRGR